ncbi:MAG: hypothetical protein A2474_03140 [Elusimicrobia bacterium RIFOXYC2_FULL_34_12]|nr:MAG: hypothetical protein A2474_03140 [Elusimicrobia bacterium RIFOXYC2_FULL_34_12]OGS38839.1 MAG: hypothetical protein A2551_03070 [Elusimicrobia bacterium RIFOXYD2_FULL_34_30]HAM38655.1 hypothetical protein [Elusimicrobiota bacterium]
MYKCKKCGHKNKKIGFNFTDFNYYIAYEKEEEEPEYLDNAPEWVNKYCSNDVEVTDPIGCPKCNTKNVL